MAEILILRGKHEIFSLRLSQLDESQNCNGVMLVNLFLKIFPPFSKIGLNSLLTKMTS